METTTSIVGSATSRMPIICSTLAKLRRYVLECDECDERRITSCAVVIRLLL
jgi:hypothetical protein